MDETVESVQSKGPCCGVCVNISLLNQQFTSEGRSRSRPRVRSLTPEDDHLENPGKQFSAVLVK